MLCAAAVVGTLGDRYQFQERTERLLTESSELTLRPSSSRLAETMPAKSAFVARLEVPRLDLNAMVVDGIDDSTLRRAVGRIPSSSLPGEPGDVALAGHRDTDFRSLQGIRRGDLVRLRTSQGPFEYRVESIRIVPPSRVDVLTPESHATLTLITCYPFRYVGAAPLRYVVRAREVTRPLRVT